MSSAPSLNFIEDASLPCLKAAGAWTASTAQAIEALADRAMQTMTGPNAIAFDLSAIDELDTYGAWMIERLSRRCADRGISLTASAVPMHFKALLAAIHKTSNPSVQQARRSNPVVAALESIGRAFPGLAADVAAFAEMLGALAAALVRVILNPRRFRLTSAVHHLDRVGWQAMPIMLLISFLIGAIIAQQGIFHFRKFGADIYVVDMVGILVMREIGVLIVAIMVAGRSGSAFTAELGSMKMREEIDAMRTLGIDPMDTLVLPRILALVVALPLLTFLGDLMGLAGGGVMAFAVLGLDASNYLDKLRDVVDFQHFMAGMIKAPFAAIIIGLVGCLEGLKVEGSAESLGTHVTSAVVKAIFLVIILDAVFAMFLSGIGV